LIYSRVKRDEITCWMKEVLSMPIEGEILNTPINELELSVRASNALANAAIKTISDLIFLGPEKLYRVKNAGKKTIYEVGNAIKKLLVTKKGEDKEEIFPEYTIATLFKADDSNETLEDALNSILAAVPPKYLPIIKARYGYEDGRCRTLEEIGNNIGITRERVRQIITKEIRRLKHSSREKVLQAILEPVEELLLKYQGIISINDFAHHEYFTSPMRNQLKFLMNLFKELYEERYRIIDRQFLTSLNDDEVNAFQYKIREEALKCRFPIEERVFIENIISAVGSISEHYLTYHLLNNERIQVSKGIVLSPGKLSISQRIRLLLTDINSPMHFSDIAELYRKHFGDRKIRASDLEHAIHTRIGDSKYFIIVGPGTFMLRDKFDLPKNINKIIETSKEILQEAKTISDTKYLISELQKQNIDIGSLNEYSLKAILLEYPSFVGYRKFEIGIEELSDSYKRKPLNNLIFEILSSTIKPMHVKTIWKEISKQ